MPNDYQTPDKRSNSNAKDNPEIVNAQPAQLSEVSELRRDGASELIILEVSGKTTMIYVKSLK